MTNKECDVFVSGLDCQWGEGNGETMRVVVMTLRKSVKKIWWIMGLMNMISILMRWV